MMDSTHRQPTVKSQKFKLLFRASHFNAFQKLIALSPDSPFLSIILLFKSFHLKFALCAWAVACDNFPVHSPYLFTRHPHSVSFIRFCSNVCSPFFLCLYFRCNHFANWHSWMLAEYERIKMNRKFMINRRKIREPNFFHSTLKAKLTDIQFVCWLF